ncbi:hypothetical protein BDZ89DRAFT_1055335, partial [Hymenopellis radicata]
MISTHNIVAAQIRGGSLCFGVRKDDDVHESAHLVDVQIHTDFIDIRRGHECQVLKCAPGCTRTRHSGAECLLHSSRVSARVSTRVRVSASGPRVPGGRHPERNDVREDFSRSGTSGRDPNASLLPPYSSIDHHTSRDFKSPTSAVSLDFTSATTTAALDFESASMDLETTLSRLHDNDQDATLEERGRGSGLPRRLPATWWIESATDRVKRRISATRSPTRSADRIRKKRSDPYDPDHCTDYGHAE